MALNRQGKWKEAARAGADIINKREEFPFGQVCETYYHLIYAKTRLGKEAEAKKIYKEYSLFRVYRPLPSYLLWLEREMTDLRRELNIAQEQPPAVTDDFWETRTPRELEMNQKAVEEYGDLCMATGADACLVVYRSKVVLERYADNTKQFLSASPLPVVGIIIGLLIDQNEIKDIYEPVSSYLPEWGDDRRRDITISHLLNMTSGLPTKKELYSTMDKDAYVSNLYPEFAPGTVWFYSLAGIQLLSPVIEQASGMNVQDYTEKYLFTPLEIESTWFNEDPKGNPRLFDTLYTTQRDLAKLGVLICNHGEWQGREIVGRDWIENLSRASQDLNPSYGLLWHKLKYPEGIGIVWSFDSHLALYPDKELIVIRIQTTPGIEQTGSEYQRKASPLISQFIGE
jgi:hypothetical protein